MDFFARQDAARRSTTLLVFYFSAAVVLIALVIYTVVALALFRGRLAHEGLSALWEPALFPVVTLSVLAVIAIGSLFKIVELRRGGSVVAESLDGRLLQTNTTGSGRTSPAQHRGGDGARLGSPLPPGLRPRRREERQRLRRRLHPRRRRHRHHAGRDARAHAGRAPGSHRPRVQPHPQRRHATQHPADGRIERHPAAGDHRYGSCSTRSAGAAGEARRETAGPPSS